MATFVTGIAGRLAKCAGSYTELAVGVDLTSGTSATITVPQFSQVLGVVVGNNTSAATLPFADTPVGNTFVITKGSSNVVTWIAVGIARY